MHNSCSPAVLLLQVVWFVLLSPTTQIFITIMAYRHVLTKQGNLWHKWSHPSLSHIAHHNNMSGKSLEDSSCLTQTPPSIRNVVLSHFHHNGGFGALSGRSNCLPGFCFPAGVGFSPSLSRYMSNAPSEGSENVDCVAEILAEETVEVVSSQTPAVIEIMASVYSSFPPAAAIQHLIESVHVLTGLNWWSAIAITTILIKVAAVPHHINQLKVVSKINPKILKNVMDKLQPKAQDVDLSHDHGFLKDVYHVFELAVIPHFKMYLMRSSIFFSFLFAISNMNENVPSLKACGAFWFTDLTTPDSLYIFPVLAYLSTLMNLELKLLTPWIRKNVDRRLKIFWRIVPVLAVPCVVGFSKAFFCYWISSSLFNLSYSVALTQPRVRKFLGLPTLHRSR